MNMKSTTGRVPVIAAPQARPMKPRSQMGVSQRRREPYLACRPAVVVKLPPRAPIPSPITKMAGSEAIAASMASWVAATNDTTRSAPGASWTVGGATGRGGAKTWSVAVAGSGGRLVSAVATAVVTSAVISASIASKAAASIPATLPRPRSRAIGQRSFHAATSSRVR